MKVDVFKILTAVSALGVFYPTPKFSLPIAFTILSYLNSGIWGILFVTLYYGFFAYIIISVIKKLSSKIDAVLTIASILFYFIVYSFQLKALWSYGDILAYATFSIFYVLSISTIILIANNSLSNHAESKK